MLVNAMIVFYHVVQLKSFSQASLKLNMSKSHVSKQISQLETDLKVVLLNRSTRRLSLTEEGEVFYQHCEAVFDCAQMGCDAIAQLRQQATGTLKVSMPPALALYLLREPLREFLATYPEVNVNIVLDSRIEDVIAQGYDAVFRSAVLSDSNLVAKKIANLRSMLCASPDYLKQYGPIKTLKQLVEQRFAAYGNGGKAHNLKFLQGQRSVSIELTSYFNSNNLELIKQMTVSGCCMAILPDFMITRELQEQQLIHCLPDYRIPNSPLYVIYPDKKFKPLRVKHFIELFKSHLERY
jgi:DNA-binding transcriptional LysR family regulator